jgi:hypothetical protein
MKAILALLGVDLVILGIVGLVGILDPSTPAPAPTFVTTVSTAQRISSHLIAVQWKVGNVGTAAGVTVCALAVQVDGQTTTATTGQRPPTLQPGVEWTKTTLVDMAYTGSPALWASSNTAPASITVRCKQ